MMGQGGGALVRQKKGGGVLPTPKELIKEKLKELAVKYGWDAAKWAWNKLKDELDQPGVWDKLKEEAAKKSAKKAKKQLATKGGGGGVLVLLALVAFSSKKKRRR